jgi:protein O-GlcNAc transferase
MNPVEVNPVGNRMSAPEKTFQQAISALNQRDLVEAERLFKDVLRSEPNHVAALNLLTVVLMSTERFAEAESVITKAISLSPGSDASYYNFGLISKRLNKPTQALQQFNKALRLNPAVSETWNNRGTIFNDLRQYNEAIFDFDQAISLKPNYSEALANKGKSLAGLRCFDEAFAAYDKALALKPDLAEAWLGRGAVLAERRRFDEAFAAYDKALALKPDLAEAWLCYGDAYADLKQYDNAFAAYEQALSLRPDLKYAEGARLHAKMHLCDWAKIETEIRHLLSAVRDQKLVSVPFVLLSMPASAADQLQCAKSFVADQASFPALWCGEIYSHDRIRLAYLSADFHDHATAYLIAGLFEHHDETRFEVSAISFGAERSSDMRLRITDAVEHFIDVWDKTDQQIAELMRKREIDIAIDLKGFTQGARFGVLARRAAPVQVSYLGYPGTLGADYIDYVIADPSIIPPEHFNYYSEQVVSLPDSYQVNDRERHIADRVRNRIECGLPDTAFVFCCFNNPYKILPEIFDIWMRLLCTRRNSVLWLFEGHQTACTNLRREAEKRGVSAERLVFAPRMPLADHLARIGLADLFLDTLPCNAHTTASDALWAGVPILTCSGQTFAGRVAASLLRAIGLPELVTTSLEDYQSLALKLAADPPFLQAIKAKLARNREAYPLFDTAQFARHIEAAYVRMWERYQRREAPQAFDVLPINKNR